MPDNEQTHPVLKASVLAGVVVGLWKLLRFGSGFGLGGRGGVRGGSVPQTFAPFIIRVGSTGIGIARSFADLKTPTLPVITIPEILQRMNRGGHTKLTIHATGGARASDVDDIILALDDAGYRSIVNQRDPENRERTLYEESTDEEIAKIRAGRAKEPAK